MNAANKQQPSLSIDNILLFATFWGGAWALGFLLGFG